MEDRFNIGEDILLYLRNQHIGAENAVSSNYMEFFYGISDAELRQVINKLRCDGQPVCENANGYFYAKNHDEINDFVQRLLGAMKETGDAAQGLILSHQVFYDGTEG